ncbi:MFS transporter [Desulfobacter hydrogenophilus]|uniref:MFS transporter n=1 Tax=Desulfobacter hydrogenophilus TaxID=2291 RepID=A0A328FGG5_9BACT|nr:MFS transporter [Desulfobacter hydrogenophilus]NDY72703.1 MFS transporter [Desulfobacter hydrogenophilus]QBH12540.1 MFS transporter [Desulfobacter hydrogenophilus]RAM03276.1 MFS transporter [Desulfobacter hydrogenophilus]
MDDTRFIHKGSRRYYLANIALFLAGFVTFATLYDFQPLFPNLVQEYGITPAMASLSLSVATFSLAFTLPFSGSLSDAVGRRPLIIFASILAPVLAFGSAVHHAFSGMLLLRLGQGIILAGVPAVAMAYLNEETEPKALGSAMGLYIAGNGMGGMSGRILTAWFTDLMGWRWALVTMALLCFVCGLLVWACLPASQNFSGKAFQPRALLASMADHLKNPGLRRLYLIAFCCMGGFVTLYNYVTFRLLGRDFGLSHTQVGLIFLAYAFGSVSSTVMGNLVNTYGRRRILSSALGIMTLGLLLTIGSSLWLVIVGIVLFTIGFFGAHSVASAWVGRLAAHSHAQASSLYLFFYYLGSSISGTIGGTIYHGWAWPGVVALILILVGIAFILCLGLQSVPHRSEPLSPHVP